MDVEDQLIFELDFGIILLWLCIYLLVLFEVDIDEIVLFVYFVLFIGGDLFEYYVEEIVDQDWECSWMDNFQLMCFGCCLWIVLSWYVVFELDVVNLLFDLGLVFGIGIYLIIVLCLEWFDGQELVGWQVFDFGCGLGIFVIVVLLFGVEWVVGIDIDLQVLEVLCDNVLCNGIEFVWFFVYLLVDLLQ